jgi:hypothetical protein
MASSGKQRTTDRLVHSTRLDLFAQAFPTEDYLRTVLADLFRKMGHTGVRITHGSNEKGKDIVFYREGPLHEKKFFACVVKNAPLTGQAEDHRNGAPTIVAAITQGVLNQITSAFNEPAPDNKGGEERFDTVYVISPYECSVAARDSVKGSLERSGQIHLICGQQLLELFIAHWPEFLWFESAVLTSYLSALHQNADSDRELANLILQKSYLQSAANSILDRYVEPTCYRDLRPRQLVIDELMSQRLLTGDRYVSELEDAARAARRIELLAYATQHGTHHGFQPLPNGPFFVAGRMLDRWQERYKQHIAALRASSTIPRAHDGPRSSRAFDAPAFIPPAPRSIAVDLDPPSDLVRDVEAMCAEATTRIDRIRADVARAARFARQPVNDPVGVLTDSEFLNYCTVADDGTVLPDVLLPSPVTQRLAFPEDLLDRTSSSVLIVGPAGYGKTTFCRWHAIRDANRLVAKEAHVLPVYKALHPLSTGTLGSFQEAFFDNEELGKLIAQQHSGLSPFTHLRLYLDGLDEVRSRARQDEIATLAKEAAAAWDFLQVIITSRDHVTSRSLHWLPRIRLRELSNEKIRLLAEKWLGSDALDVFFTRVHEAGSLGDLMKVPLLATLILAVYRKTSAVPPDKAKLYGLFVELLCGGWDFYKNVQRRPNVYSTRDKEVALSRLAGILQHGQKRDATDADFHAAVKYSLSFLEPDWQLFLQEIIEDGLLVRVGSLLLFAHLSFQEFLAAKDLQGPQAQRPKQALSWYLNGKDWWKEVLGFYVTLTDRPGDTDEWILDRALASTSTAPDLVDRVSWLRTAIQSAFPSYQETTAARQRWEKLLTKTKNRRGNPMRTPTGRQIKGDASSAT